MPRDTSRLTPIDKKTYDDFAKVFGEVYADNWYDKNVKIPAAAPTAAPIAAPIAGEEVLGEMLRPSTGQMQARLLSGDFAARPSMQDVFLEEQKALEAQKQRFVDIGEKTDADVRLEIATGLSQQGLSPIGPTSDEYKRRFEEEYGAAQTAEKKAAEVVAPAREARTPGFVPKKPFAQASTIAKDPTQVEGMTGPEAVIESFRPQVLETPDETLNRQGREVYETFFNDSADRLAQEMEISLGEAKKKILDQTKQQFRMDAVYELGIGFTNEDYDAYSAEKYDNWLKQNLPSEYSKELRERTDTIAGSKALVEDVRSRSLDFLLGVAATDKYDPQVYKEFKQSLGIAPQTEAVIESLPMTTVRDLAGLSRFVFNPLLDLAFYDVEPGTDEKINPEEYGFFPRERTGPKEQGAWGKSYIAARTPDSPEDSLREIAVEIATARSLGDDLAASASVKPEDEEGRRTLGILTEIALPINLLSVPGRTVKGAKAFAKAVRLADAMPASVTEMFSALAKVGELPGEVAGVGLRIPENLYNTLIVRPGLVEPLQQAAKKAGVSVADLATAMNRNTDFLDTFIDANRVSSVVAINTADQYNALRWIASGAKLEEGSPIAKLIEKDAEAIYKAVTNPAVENPQKMAQQILEDASKSKSPVSSNTAKSALIPVSDAALVSEEAYGLSRQTIRNALVEDLTDTSIGGWTFLTPNVVTTTPVAKKALPVLAPRIKSAMESLVSIDPTTGKITSKGPIPVEELLKNSVVQLSSPRRKYYAEMLGGLVAGDDVSQDVYRAINTLVSENEIYKISKGEVIGTGAKTQPLGAFAPSRAGRAVQSASEPIELRSDLIQYTKQLGQDFKRKFFPERFLKAPPSKYVDAVANQYAGFLEGFPAQFTNTVKALNKAGKNEREIYGALLARTYSQEISMTSPQAVSAIERWKLNSAQIEKFKSDIQNLEERVATYNRGKQNARISGRPTASFNTSIRNATKEIQDIEKRIAKLQKESDDASKALRPTPFSKTGAIAKPSNVDLIPVLSADDSIKAAEDVMKAQFGLSDFTSPQGQRVQQIIESNRSLFENPLASNSDALYDNLLTIRSQIVEEIPELLNREAVSTLKRGAKTFQRNSLPETILAITFENSKRAAFTELIAANKPQIYNDIAVRGVDEIAGGIVSDKQIIDAVNRGVAARLDNPASANIADEIRQSLRASGVDESTIDELFAKKGVDLIDSVNYFAIDAYRRSPGWMAVDGSETLRRLNAQVTKIGDSPQLAILPDKMQADIRFIQEQLKNAGRDPVAGRQIAEIATELERQSPGLVGRAMSDLASFAGNSYSSLVEGMLAGRALPNVTYLSENILGAPLIAAVTNPEYIGAVLKTMPEMLGKGVVQAFPGASVAFDDFRRYGGYTAKYFDRARAFPEAKAFVTDMGETITNERLWELITQARLGRAQASVVADPRVINQVRDLVEILGSGAKYPTELAKQLGDAIPSGRLGVPLTVASNVDMAFRQELFVEALRRGKTPVEASAIARDTLLDYNKLNEILPEKLGALRKPFLFMSFSASMSLAILKGMTRGDSVENILRLARYHRSLAKNSGVFAPDGPMLESLFLEQQELVGDKPSTYLYARDPVMGQIIWMGNLADSVKNVVLGPDRIAAGIEGFEQLGFVPWYDFVKDMLTARKGTINARQVARWESLGMWEWAQENFDLEEVPIEKMRRGEGTFEGRQYKFKTDAAKRSYLAYEQLFAVAGWNRTTSDYFNTLQASGAVPKDAYLARYSRDNPQFEGVQSEGSLVNGLLYMVIRQRAVRPPTQIELYDRQIQTELRKLKDLQFEQVEE